MEKFNDQFTPEDVEIASAFTDDELRARKKQKDILLRLFSEFPVPDDDSTIDDVGIDVFDIIKDSVCRGKYNLIYWNPEKKEYDWASFLNLDNCIEGAVDANYPCVLITPDCLKGMNWIEYDDDGDMRFAEDADNEELNGFAEPQVFFDDNARYVDIDWFNVLGEIKEYLIKKLS
jgi:hypothetical protein